MNVEPTYQNLSHLSRIGFEVELCKSGLVRVGDRFWRSVSDDRQGCWIWKGCHDEAGYGRFAIAGRLLGAHRISFMMEHGYPPDPFCLHHCDNPACVNPGHLYEGTRLDNSRDMVLRGRAPVKLNDAKVREIIALRESGETLRRIASAYGVTIRTICVVCERIGWRHVEGFSDIQSTRMAA